MVVKAVAHKVDIVVHHRGFVPRLGSDVRVTLLRWTRRPADPIPRRDDPSHVVPGQHPVGHRRRRGAQLGRRHHVTDRSPAGWSFVGTNAATRRKTLTGQDLDNMRIGAWRRSTSTSARSATTR